MMGMMWNVTEGCSKFEPLPQGMHDRRVSSPETEARLDRPSKPTENAVATQSPTHARIPRRGSLAPVHGDIGRPAPSAWSRSARDNVASADYRIVSNYTTRRLATAEPVNTGWLHSCSTNASVRSADGCSKSSCDGYSEGRIVQSCVDRGTMKCLQKSPGVGCWSRSKAGNPSLVRCGRQHFVHGNSNKRHVLCLLIDSKLRNLHSSGTFSPGINSIDEQLVVGAWCTVKMRRQQLQN